MSNFHCILSFKLLQVGWFPSISKGGRGAVLLCTVSVTVSGCVLSVSSDKVLGSPPCISWFCTFSTLLSPQISSLSLTLWCSSPSPYLMYNPHVCVFFFFCSCLGCEFHCKRVDSCYRAVCDIPKTYREAIMSNRSRQWKEAMDDEVKSVEQNKTFSLTR